VQAHITHWHTRYRVVGGGGAGIERLDRVARERVAAAYASAVEGAFAGDPAVYVLRRVHAELTVQAPSFDTEIETARRWAGRIYAGVVRTITREGDRPDAVARFENTADYVARFLADLLDGAAWERWYYGAFSAYRGLATPEAVRRILLDFAAELPAVFRRLAQLGRLRATIRTLTPDDAAEVWRTAIRRIPDPPSPEAFRVFVRAAIALARALEIGTDALPSEDEILLQFFASAPPEPDWKQPRSLAEAVYAAISFLGDTGFLLWTAPGARERLVRNRDALLAPLEWLDREWLAGALDARLSRPVGPGEPLRPAPSARLSPVQRRVLEALLQLLASRAAPLPDGAEHVPEYALALYAALSAAEPDLASHPAAAAILETLIARWQAEAAKAASQVAASRPLLSFVASVLAGDTTARDAASPIAPAVGPHPPAHDALALVPAATENAVACSCAGLFLLSRAVLEARLTQLADALGLSVPAVLLALAAEWAGNAPDALDAGALFWAGFDPQAGRPSIQIAALERPARERLCEAIERVLQDRSAFAPSLAPRREPGAPPLAAIALHLFRLWAHWLPGVAHSTPQWLLDRLIRRRGSIRAESRVVAVSLRPAPLDVVLEMAGYLKPIASASWLGDRRITFAIDREMS
jgi:hypothetical protein